VLGNVSGVATFSPILRSRLARAAAEPLVTFYDSRSGERTELSVATYANWVAKTSSLLLEEYDVERGGRVLVDLPAHWLGPVFLGAIWNLGATVVLGEGAADLVVCGPEGIQTQAGGGVPVLATALHPLGRPFTAPLPDGVDDFGAVVWSQPDAFTPYDPAREDDPAFAGDLALGQGEMWSAAATGSLLTGGGRLFTEANPASPSGFASFTQPLVLNGSVVLVVGDRTPDWPEWVDSVCATERVTDRSR
jgi:uncharacterized protein (TIGR03089 family)